jgi:cullin 1
VFINDNAVVQAAKSASRSPELLAKYCDNLLKKSSKTPDEQELEPILGNVMLIFKVAQSIYVLLVLIATVSERQRCVPEVLQSRSCTPPCL